MLTKDDVGVGMKILYIFALVFLLHSDVSGYGSAKEGKCPPLGDVNCANNDSKSAPYACSGQDFECPGDDKCCEDGCEGYECKPAIGLPPLPVIEPHCISAEIRVGDQCEPANITYCYADRCNSCCVHNSVCNPTSEHISLEKCKEKLCDGIECPGQGEICALDKYHRAVCECPTECPPDAPAAPVCGSDGVTYENECEMNMTACVTGDWIQVVNQGSCRRSPSEVCSMPKEKGFGWTLDLKYYFNQQKGICEGFIYHGKGGNDNNFERYKDCVDMCLDTITDVCALPKIVGPCRAAFPRWHFNSEVQRCQGFTFGGCAGNGNNFKSEAECNNQCVCNLPKAPGICLGYFPSWFFNSETGKCENFVYGGCRGNANRFYSKERCQNRCGVGKVDPFITTPRCYGENKFNCRSIKKCLSVSKKCNGVDDCGDNSDEEGCDPCASKKCDFYSTCLTTQNNTALCDCPTICTADWSPVCGSDNETYPNLCTMQVESCKTQQLITKASDGECNARAKSKCELHREQQLNQLLIGVYIPQCEEDGSYSSRQCHGSTGYCWCVDGEGNKLEETEVGPGQRLNCTTEIRPKTKCENERDARENGPLLVGAFTPQCEEDGSYSSRQCHGSTGYCWCVDGEGNKLEETEVGPGQRLNCTTEIRPKTKCENERDARENGPLLVGAFTPQCEDDGSYSSRQCHGSTGYCWCVDGEGNKLEETEVGPGQRLNCSAGPPPTDPPFNICDISLCEFGRCVEVDGNATCQCNPICPLIYNPVCGTNNKTYPNPCVMESEACQKKQHIRMQYPGECGSRPTEGPTATHPPFNICDISLCEFGRCVEVDGNATCQCNKACPRIYNPVCGTDNKTYSNPCVMDSETCEREEHVRIQHRGECKNVENLIRDPCQDFECKFYGVCVPLVNGSVLCECPLICTRELDPVCGSDGSTYSNPCEMEVSSCEKKELITIQYPGKCESRRISGGPLSKCEKERAASENGPLLVGAFTPQCEADGSYSEVQCHGSTGYCWCVDGEGNKRVETEVGRGLRPNCTDERAREMTKCEKERAARDNGPLLLGAFTPQCEADGSYSEVQCHGSTGYCWCVDGEGNKRVETEVGRGLRPNCTEERVREMSKCEKERAARENGPLLLGAFTPQCEADGSYSEVQCHGSTGYCWCVDGEGNKRVETEVGRGLRPNCTEERVREMSKCEKERAARENGPLLVGAFTPQCEADGSYSEVQCHGSTGYCWCVDGEGNKRAETEVGRGLRPNCTTEIPPTESPFDVCDISLCDFGVCVNENGTAKCVCNNACPFIEQPVCGSDNKTYSNLCVMDAEACERKTYIKAKHNGPCGKKSKCQKELEIANELLKTISDTFIPRCEEDGSYSPKQCDNNTAYCWCSTPQGEKILETQMRFEQPDCSKTKSSDPCADVTCDFYATCVALDNGDHICDCPRFCTREYAPVCASDGKTYGNTCEMQVASCSMQEMLFVEKNGECDLPTTTEPPFNVCDISLCDFGVCVNENGTATCVCNNACPFIEQPVCGSDNKTYSNLCVMDAEACEHKERVTVQHDGPCETVPSIVANPCDLLNCSFYGECELYNGEARCVCKKACTRELDPKCGSDGITYSNPCELRRISCEEKREINIVMDGECITPKTAPAIVVITEQLPKCKNCPTFGKDNVINSFCSFYNKFAIIGEVLNSSANGREITVKVETKYKPTAEKTKFTPKNTVNIKVQKPSNCRCDNLDFQKNEKYVLMGRKSKKRTFVIKWRTGFVEKVSQALVDRLKKSSQRLKTWGFCPQRQSG